MLSCYILASLSTGYSCLHWRQMQLTAHWHWCILMVWKWDICISLYRLYSQPWTTILETCFPLHVVKKFITRWGLINLISLWSCDRDSTGKTYGIVILAAPVLISLGGKKCSSFEKLDVIQTCRYSLFITGESVAVSCVAAWKKMVCLFACCWKQVCGLFQEK